MTNDQGGPAPDEPRRPPSTGAIILRVLLFLGLGFFVFVMLVLGTCFLKL